MDLKKCYPASIKSHQKRICGLLHENEALYSSKSRRSHKTFYVYRWVWTIFKGLWYRAEFETLDGDKPYEEAEKFVKNAIERNLPVIYLMLRHRDKEFKDLNWHWFCITGYKTEKEEVQQRQIKNSCIHTASIQANEINKNKIKEGVNLEERVYLNYHTYGEALSVDFKRLWNTGMYKRGGMVALKNIKQ